MSTYALPPVGEQQFTSHFDKVHMVQNYQNSLHHHHATQLSLKGQGNFSVSHILDLEELPRENCAMYANTDHGGSPSPPHNHHHSSMNQSSCAHSNSNKTSPALSEKDRGMSVCLLFALEECHSIIKTFTLLPHKTSGITCLYMSHESTSPVVLPSKSASSATAGFLVEQACLLLGTRG